MRTKTLMKCIYTFVNKQGENGDETQIEPVKLCLKASQVWEWSPCAVMIDVLFDVKENKTLCKPCGSTLTNKNTTDFYTFTQMNQLKSNF